MKSTLFIPSRIILLGILLSSFILSGISLLSVAAEAIIITTPLNVSTGSEFVTISTEEWTTSYNCNISAVNNRLVNFNRNLESGELVSCRTALGNITQTMQSLSESFKDSKAYYPLYTECFSNLTLCRDEGRRLTATASGKELAEEQKRSCSEQLIKVENDRNSKENNYKTCNDDLLIANEELKKAKGDRIWWAAGGAAIVGAFAYYRYEKKLAGETQIDKGFPQRR